MAIKSIYHNTDKMGEFSGEKFYTSNQDLIVSDIVYVVSSQGTGEHLLPFLEGKFRVSHQNKGRYVIRGTVYEYESLLSPELLPDFPVPLADLRSTLGRRTFASRFMNQVKPKLSPFEVEGFDDLLIASNSDVPDIQEHRNELEQDLSSLLSPDTETLRLVMARIGQGKFRDNVTKVWNVDKEMCALTGIALGSVLTASHIVPWRECIGHDENLRLDGANGILLCAHIDRLFDRYLISFKRGGRSAGIVYSKTISPDIMNQLQLTGDLELVPNQMKEEDRERFFSCIARHYEKFVFLERER